MKIVATRGFNIIIKSYKMIITITITLILKTEPYYTPPSINFNKDRKGEQG